MRVKGLTKNRSGMIVSTDATKLEVIRQKRAQKKTEDELRARCDFLQKQLDAVTSRVLKLEAARG